MAKTITITDVIVKEVQISLVPVTNKVADKKTGRLVATETEEYVMNVLYSQVDADGNEYPMGWEPIKGSKLTTKIISRLESVLESAKEETLKKQGL